MQIQAYVTCTLICIENLLGSTTMVQLKEIFYDSTKKTTHLTRSKQFLHNQATCPLKCGHKMREWADPGLYEPLLSAKRCPLIDIKYSLQTPSQYAGDVFTLYQHYNYLNSLNGVFLHSKHLIITLHSEGVCFCTLQHVDTPKS